MLCDRLKVKDVVVEISVAWNMETGSRYGAGYLWIVNYLKELAKSCSMAVRPSSLRYRVPDPTKVL